MEDYSSAWARQKFGTVEPELRRLVTRAIVEAHASAADAQMAGNTPKQDPYGHTLKNTQHERLVEELRHVPGVDIHRPTGARYDLARLTGRRVTFYPLRYASDGHTPRESVSIRMSAIRQDLLGAPETIDRRQLTIDQVELSSEEIDEQFAADKEISDQLGSLSCVVIIGYASSNQGIHDLGWGEADLAEDGHLHWRHWERLPVPGSSTGGSGFGDLREAVPAAPRHDSSAGVEPGRFDDEPAGDLVISARHEGADEHQQAKPVGGKKTGTSEGQA